MMSMGIEEYGGRRMFSEEENRFCLGYQSATLSLENAL